MQPSGGAPAVAPLAVWQALAVEDWNAAAAAALTEALRAAGEDAANAVYTSDGETLPLLQHAVHMESLDKVKLLLREGARPDEIDTSDDEAAEERESAFHLAAHMKAQDPAFNAQVMEALLDALASQLHGAQVRWLHRHEDPRLQHHVQERLLAHSAAHLCCKTVYSRWTSTRCAAAIESQKSGGIWAWRGRPRRR